MVGYVVGSMQWRCDKVGVEVAITMVVGAMQTEVWLGFWQHGNFFVLKKILLGSWLDCLVNFFFFSFTLTIIWLKMQG